MLPLLSMLVGNLNGIYSINFTRRYMNMVDCKSWRVSLKSPSKAYIFCQFVLKLPNCEEGRLLPFSNHREHER